MEIYRFRPGGGRGGSKELTPKIPKQPKNIDKRERELARFLHEKRKAGEMGWWEMIAEIALHEATEGVNRRSVLFYIAEISDPGGSL